MKSNGISFFGLLTLLFVGLKLTNFIDWSWWLVLLPAYGSFAVAIVVMILALIIAAIAAGLSDS